MIDPITALAGIQSAVALIKKVSKTLPIQFLSLCQSRDSVGRGRDERVGRTSGGRRKKRAQATRGG